MSGDSIKKSDMQSTLQSFERYYYARSHALYMLINKGHGAQAYASAFFNFLAKRDAIIDVAHYLGMEIEKSAGEPQPGWGREPDDER